ncbi:MAG: leucine-rich repeat domain-containing protein [archaeon]|nr:leucine-rich repeat domain-containing protein [archaeon]
MSKGLFLILCLFSLGSFIKTENEIESIKLMDEFNQNYYIDNFKSFEIQFNSQIKPTLEGLQISIQSVYNLRQKVSFSDSDEGCSNSKMWWMSENPKEKSLDFILNKDQLRNKFYLCVKCKYDCEFDLKINKIDSTDSNKNLRKESSNDSKIKIDFESLIQREIPKESSNSEIFSNDAILIKLYGSDLECRPVPSDKPQSYQITHIQGTKYKSSGSSANCTDEGLIKLKATIWYWYGGIGYSSPIPGKEPDRITVEYNYGSSIITATHPDNTTETYNVTVLDYATEYAEEQVDLYIAKNVTGKKTDMEKLDSITFYPATFPYDYHYSGWVSMVACGGADCWGSASLIKKLCDKVGIRSHVRYAVNDPGAGSGHKNTAALVDGSIYICEAGYSGTSVPRMYHISKENVGWFYSRNKDNKLTILQYDGFESVLNIPSEIDGYTVIGLGEDSIRIGPSYTGVDITSITLPDTLESIGDSSFNSMKIISKIKIPSKVSKIGNFVFTNMKDLKEIEVVPENPYYASVDGILYDKNLKNITFYPSGKVGEINEGNLNDASNYTSYTAPDSLTTVGYYSFYYTSKIQKVILPKGVNSIEEGAFGDSVIKEIYFSGPPPAFSQFCFHGLNFTLYWPKEHPKWDIKKMDKYNAKAINFVEWMPPGYKIPMKTGTKVLIGFIVVLVLAAIGGGIAFYFLKIRKNSDYTDLKGKAMDMKMGLVK